MGCVGWGGGGGSRSPCPVGTNLHNNMLAQGTVTNEDNDNDVGLHEYSC